MTFHHKLDLSIERIVDVKPEQVWKVWTNPENVKNGLLQPPGTLSQRKSTGGRAEPLIRRWSPRKASSIPTQGAISKS